MRYLKTAYGDFLDLHERVVGDFFDDRANGNIRNSILEVHTYPPKQDQLDILQRFSSLAPASSVRPRKRPLELPSQSDPSQSQFSQRTHRQVPSVEGWDAEAITSVEGTKRQRTQELSGRPFPSSQTSGTQGSIHQVLDSQKPPGKKRASSSFFYCIVILIYHADSNPYGTPTSLALVGQQVSVPSSEIDLSAIPDSPLARDSTSARGAFAGAVPLDRESAKSESPELRASVPEVPAAASTDAPRAEELVQAKKAKAQAVKAQARAKAKAKVKRAIREEAQKEALLLPPRTARETATAVKEQAQQRIAEREAQKLRSSSDIQSQRSMTPRMPGSSVTKSSSLMTSLRSSHTSNQSPGNTDAPLRSALRQTPSSLHRSASSVSFNVAQPANLSTRNAPTSNSKSPKEINHEAAAKTPSATNFTTSPPGNISKPPSKTSIQTPVPQKASGRKITKTPAKNGKVQTKLNVTRQPKKLKDRAYTPPVKSTQAAPSEAIVISSGEDSSTSEEPSWQTGNAEAGPSSRKPTLPVVSQKIKPAEVQASVTRIPPGVRTKKTQMDSTVTPAALPRRNSTLDKASMPKSISLSPAQITSETISISSDSASDKEPQVPPSKVPSGTKGLTRKVPGTVKKLSKDVNEVVKQPEDHLKGKNPPQSVTRVPPSPSRRIIPAKGNGEHINQAADRQLQLESRRSIPDFRINTASSIPNGAPGDTIINQGLDHAGRLPNGIRPAYYDYPKLSELQKLPRAVTPEPQPKINSISSQPIGDSPVSRFGSEYSSSDGDQRSSSPDGDEDVDGRPPQLGSPKPYPGVKKLAQSR